MVAALVDHDGMIRQTRRVGAPVSFDTSSTSVKLYMRAASAGNFIERARAALSYSHPSHGQSLFFNGHKSTLQRYAFLPYSKRLMAVICYRIF